MELWMVLTRFHIAVLCSNNVGFYDEIPTLLCKLSNKEDDIPLFLVKVYVLLWVLTSVIRG